MSEFDELLDQVLKEDARVEPRQGFEQRILAGLRGESPRKRGLWMWWAPAAACAAVVLGTVLMLQHGRSGQVDTRAAGANQPARNTASGAAGKIVPSMHEAPTELPRKIGGARVSHMAKQGLPLQSEMARGVAETRLPKMETFPAVAQTGGFLPEPPDTTAAKELREAADSPQVALALRELKEQQERPLQVNAIEIEPL
jgi:hypothetical protein